MATGGGGGGRPLSASPRQSGKKPGQQTVKRSRRPSREYPEEQRTESPRRASKRRSSRTPACAERGLRAQARRSPARSWSAVPSTVGIVRGSTSRKAMRIPRDRCACRSARDTAVGPDTLDLVGCKENTRASRIPCRRRVASCYRHDGSCQGLTLPDIARRPNSRAGDAPQPSAEGPSPVRQVPARIAARPTATMTARGLGAITRRGRNSRRRWFTRGGRGAAGSPGVALRPGVDGMCSRGQHEPYVSALQPHETTAEGPRPGRGPFRSTEAAPAFDAVSGEWHRPQ